MLKDLHSKILRGQLPSPFEGENAIENLRHHISPKGKICPYGVEFVEHAFYPGVVSFPLNSLLRTVFRPI